MINNFLKMKIYYTNKRLFNNSHLWQSKVHTGGLHIKAKASGEQLFNARLNK